MRSSCQCIQVETLTILSKLAVVIETILLYPVSHRRASAYSYIQVFNDFLLIFFFSNTSLHHKFPHPILNLLKRLLRDLAS